MWVKLETLKERDFDLEILDFQNIGLIRLWIERVKNKFEGYIKSHTQRNVGIDISYLLLIKGHNDIPNKEITDLDGMNIKVIHTYERSIANEMWFSKYLIKV